MDVQKVKTKKREAEAKIFEILDKLQQQTCCNITNLHYTYEETGLSYNKGVRLEITLEV